LDNFLNLCIVVLCFFLDGVEFLNEALLSIGVSLGKLGLNLFLLSFLLGRLAFPNKLDLVVMSFGFFLNVG